VLPAGPTPVRVLGIDETRRGKDRHEGDTWTGWRCGSTGSTLAWSIYTAPAACPAGQRPHFGCVIAWLKEQNPESRAAITHVWGHISWVQWFAEVSKLTATGQEVT
jgi:hypothetical protein